MPERGGTSGGEWGWIFDGGSADPRRHVMVTNLRLRQLTQVVLSVAVIAGVVLVTAAKSYPRRSEAEADHPGLWTSMEALFRAEAGDGSDSQADMDREDLRQLPAYVDVAQSVKQLNRARSVLLRAAAVSDAEATQRAVREYRQAVERVRSGLATLKDYVDPEQFQTLARQLLTVNADNDDGRVATPESLLGILPRVSRS